MWEIDASALNLTKVSTTNKKKNQPQNQGVFKTKLTHLTHVPTTHTA